MKKHYIIQKREKERGKKWVGENFNFKKTNLIAIEQHRMKILQESRPDRKNYPVFMTKKMAKSLLEFIEDFNPDFKNYYANPTAIQIKLKRMIEIASKIIKILQEKK